MKTLLFLVLTVTSQLSLAASYCSEQQVRAALKLSDQIPLNLQSPGTAMGAFPSGVMSAAPSVGLEAYNDVIVSYIQEIETNGQRTQMGYNRMVRCYPDGHIRDITEEVRGMM